MTLWKDGERRRRLVNAAIISVVISILAGALAFLVVSLESAIRRPRPLLDDAMAAFNTVAVVFWATFTVQLLIEVTKSKAVLEFERRVHQAEELFQGRRIPR